MNVDNREMFYGAKPVTFVRARNLRKNMTISEQILWGLLKNKGLLNLHFRRQHPLNYYIADFYCHKIKLVIEIDGGIHNKMENMLHDNNRTDELNGMNIQVIRFKNEDVLNDLHFVKSKIEHECMQILKKQE